MPQTINPLMHMVGTAARSRVPTANTTGLMRQAEQAGMTTQPPAAQAGMPGQPGQGQGQPQGGGAYQSFLSMAKTPQGFPQAQPVMPVGSAPGLPGTTSLSEMGNYLGRLYGIDIGGQGLFDNEGTALRTPRNADEAAAFNLISQRLADEKTKASMKKAEVALQQQQGLLQRSGRGSLSAFAAGGFGQMADLYSQQQFNPTDFGYWIAKEFQEKQERLARDQMRAMKKAAKYKMYGDIATGITTLAVGGMFCWVAEELFGENDERTHFARIYCGFNQDKLFVRLYQRHGREWAKILRAFPRLKPLVRWIWEDMARKGELIYVHWLSRFED